MQTLTPKQAAFCREYVVDLNATQAAIRAGYSPRTANEQGARSLAKASVQSEVRRLFDNRMQRVEVTADFVVRMLVENVQRSMQAIPVRDAEGSTIGQFRYDGTVANKALELLGRHIGMFTEKRAITLQTSDTVISELLERVEQSSNIIDAAYIERAAIGITSEGQPA